MECDHVLAKANGGMDDMDNLITACRTCNIGKGTQDAFTQYSSPADHERLKGIPKRMRSMWVVTGRCDGCRRVTDDVEAWDGTHICIDCANDRVEKGMIP